MRSANSRINVVFLRTESDQFTGAPKMLFRLVSGLDTERFNPTIVTQKEGELTQKARNAGINVKIIPYRGILDSYQESLLTVSPTKNLATIIRIGQYNIEAQNTLQKADVLWCAGTRTLLTIAPTILSSDVTTIWNVGLARTSDGVDKYLNEACFRLADHIFIESEEQAQRAFRSQYNRFEDKFTVFYKGVDTEKFRPQPTTNNSDEIHIGTAGSLIPRKGHLQFLKAINKLIIQGYDVQASIAGGTSHGGVSEYERQLREYVTENNLENVVDFRGWIDADDMPMFYNEIDIFVLASENEGIPGVVREAMACETPVIATNVGGTSEAIQDGTTGYLIESNSADVLTESIIDLIEQPDHQDEIAQASRNHIRENFSIKSYIEDYQQFLIRVV